MQTGAGDVSALDNFTDADKNAWYAGAMAKAVELKIFYGDGDSIYPDRPVTRQELFTILVRAFSVTGGDSCMGIMPQRRQKTGADDEIVAHAEGKLVFMPVLQFQLQSSLLRLLPVSVMFPIVEAPP